MIVSKVAADSLKGDELDVYGCYSDPVHLLL